MSKTGCIPLKTRENVYKTAPKARKNLGFWARTKKAPPLVFRDLKTRGGAFFGGIGLIHVGETEAEGGDQRHGPGWGADQVRQYSYPGCNISETKDTIRGNWTLYFFIIKSECLQFFKTKWHEFTDSNPMVPAIEFWGLRYVFAPDTVTD